MTFDFAVFFQAMIQILLGEQVICDPFFSSRFPFLLRSLKCLESSNPWNIFFELLPADSPAEALSPAERDLGMLLFFELYKPKDRRM